MKRSLFERCLCAVGVALFLASPAVAKDRTPEPKGIVTNGFILHPGADLSIGVDSYEADNVGASVDGLIDVGVHFKTRLEHEENYSWDNKLSFNWRQYWGLGLLGSTDGGASVSVSTSADLFKKSMFKLSPEASYHYSASAEDANLNSIPDNHTITVGTYGSIQPGGGSVFYERLGYHFSDTIYPDDPTLTHMEHRIESRTQWNFLPQTHMALDVDFRIIHFTESERETSYIYDDSTRTNPFGLPLRLKYSLGGLFTTRLSYDIAAGYTYIYYDPNKPVHSWLLSAKVRYDFTNNIGLQAGYKHDYETATFGDYYLFHKAEIGFDALFFDRLQTELKFAYAYNTYTVGDDNNARNDHFLTADLNLYYSFLSGLRLGVNYKLRADIADMVDCSYLRNSAYLTLSYEY